MSLPELHCFFSSQRHICFCFISPSICSPQKVITKDLYAFLFQDLPLTVSLPPPVFFLASNLSWQAIRTRKVACFSLICVQGVNASELQAVTSSKSKQSKFILGFNEVFKEIQVFFQAYYSVIVDQLGCKRYQVP